MKNSHIVNVVFGCLVVLIIFLLSFNVFDHYTNKDSSIVENSISMSNLFLSVATVVFVFYTFKSQADQLKLQKEQNDRQKEQNDRQREEIKYERGMQEYSRAFDLITDRAKLSTEVYEGLNKERIEKVLDILQTFEWDNIIYHRRIINSVFKEISVEINVCIEILDRYNIADQRDNFFLFGMFYRQVPEVVRELLFSCNEIVGLSDFAKDFISFGFDDVLFALAAKQRFDASLQLRPLEYYSNNPDRIDQGRVERMRNDMVEMILEMDKITSFININNRSIL